MLDSDALPAALADSAPIRQAQKELDKIAQSPEEREAYRMRLMKARDDRARVADARRAGLEEGLLKGLEEGLLIGEVRRLQTLLGIPLSSIELLRKCELAELKRQVAELERRSAKAL